MNNDEHYPVLARLCELWFTYCHKAMCRRVEGGLLAYLPSESSLSKDYGLRSRQLALLLSDGKLPVLGEQASEIFGSEDFSACTLLWGSEEQFYSGTESVIELKYLLRDLQSYLLEPTQSLPEDAALLAFLIQKLDYRSKSVPIKRITYHVVPSGKAWKVKRRGDPDGKIFSKKDEAVKYGVSLARAHIEGQLIIHKADGRFQEERTYGTDPPGTAG